MTNTEMPELARRFKDAVELYGGAYALGVDRPLWRGNSGELLAQYHAVELHQFTDLANELEGRIKALQTALVHLGVARELYELGGRTELMAYQDALITAHLNGLGGAN